MNITSINLISYSPTGTTNKVLNAIAKAIDTPKKQFIDLTKESFETKDVNENQLSIIGAPVYSGRVAITAVERLKKLKGNNSPAVVVVLYGNREFEDALIELKDLASSIGFIPIFAAAFIGEHSYSDNEHQIALGRPDTKDLELADKFGKEIAQKLYQNEVNDITELIKIPGNAEYKERREFPEISPRVENESCSQCGKCIAVCPISAISMKNEGVQFDQKLCTLCCACVKNCDSQAIIFDDPWIMNIRNMLVEKCSVRKEPELFF